MNRQRWAEDRDRQTDRRTHLLTPHAEMSHHTLPPPQLILYDTKVKSFIRDHHVEDDQLLGRDDYSLAGWLPACLTPSFSP